MTEPQTRTTRTITIYDRCTCGKVLMKIIEGERGTCDACWYRDMPLDTKESIRQLIAAAFRPTSEKVRGELVDDAMSKLKRDEP